MQKYFSAISSLPFERATEHESVELSSNIMKQLFSTFMTISKLMFTLYYLRTLTFVPFVSVLEIALNGATTTVTESVIPLTTSISEIS